MNKILIIDDEITIGALLSKFLSRNGFEVNVATSGLTAFEFLSKEKYDLVICDYRLEDTDGREILKKIRLEHPETSVIIITGYSDIKIAVELIKMGAYDYITKPLYPDEILNTINQALEHQKNSSTGKDAEKRHIINVDTSKSQTELDNFITGKSKVSQELVRQIGLVAPTNYSVIISGESGTGKEFVAKSIHLNSLRKDGPFVAMDCGSLTKELAGSEFFGHEKGSFTGAMFTKIGHFELANGGTLFLDEVANLSYDLQAALLRTVQERKVKRIGSTKEIDLDVRIIVATNENLLEAIQKGRFREDLYHRFNEFNISLPPLRDRENDIMAFAEDFLSRGNIELNREIKGFSEDVTECFKTYGWSGNIRELKNVIRRAMLLTEGNIIQLNTLPLEISTFAKNSFIENVLSQNISSTEVTNQGYLKNVSMEAEYETILRVLKEVKFNKTKAAQILNIDRKTLYNKMKSVNLE
ncbi:sigma-54-dependent transcriptional regulator [Daejeonella oryzae]|uniref:sigma-54-dependent transcriptional regulator n=1 Tax=Daejeonella oryzae TaxID=1122943 RepID=UPI00041A3EDC|nr:sigma-54 dependent transcriptional regulator [Daejeonella oryzae]